MGKLIASCAMGLAAALLPLALVFAAALLADRAAGTGGGGIVGWASNHNADELAIFLGLTALVTAAALYFELIWFAEIGSMAGVELRKRVFASLIALPLGFFEGSRMNEVADMVESDLERVQSAWSRDWRILWRCCLLVLATTVALFMIEPQLAGIVAGAFAGIAALTCWLLKITPGRNIPGTGVFSEAVQSLPLLKSFASENHERGRLRQALALSTASERDHTRWRSGIFAMAGLLVFAVVIYYLWYRGQQIDRGDGSFEAGRTLAFVLLTAVLVGAAARLARALMNLSAAGESAQRAAMILGETSEQLESGPYLPDSRGRLEGRVEFDKVGSTAQGAMDGLVEEIENITLTMEPGQKIALVGDDQSGKALLLELMLGFHEIDSGDVRIDGRSLKEYPLAWLRSQIGWLPRQPQFISATIAENVAYGCSGASAEEIREAAEKAGAVEFIDKLPDRFETKIVSGADCALSRDQRHRLAMARLFLKDPPLLAFEELDSSEVELPKTGNSNDRAGGGLYPKIVAAEDRLMKNRTTLVVARRMSTTRDADRILVIRDGRVEEKGTHAELYETKGYYRLLCEGQFGRH